MSIKQLADAAGVSVSTASRALNGTGRVSERTREHVIEVARELNYHPNELARQLKGGTSSTLAVVVPDITNPFFPRLVQGIQEVADASGYVVILAQAGETQQSTLDAISALLARQVAGVIVADDHCEPAALAEVLGSVPLVTVDRQLDLVNRGVASDHRAGARTATEHLIELGHKRIAHIAGRQSIDVARERYRGYVDALESHGIEVDSSLMVEADFEERAGVEAAKELLSRGWFSALFAANDLLAIGAMGALREQNKRIPEDVSIVGFDDIPFVEYVTPGLTTVRQEAAQLGRLAAKAIIDGPADTTAQRALLPVDLIVRGTTAAWNMKEEDQD